jgi:hypothetical protein
VQSVPAPARLSARRIAVAALLAALAAGVAIAAVLVLSPDRAPAAHAYNGLVQGVPLQSARCVQWNAASDAERKNVAGALSHSVGGATPYGRGTTLSTDEALALFDRACSSPIAQNWLLYELYIRAAGFRSYNAPQT